MEVLPVETFHWGAIELGVLSLIQVCLGKLAAWFPGGLQFRYQMDSHPHFSDPAAKHSCTEFTLGLSWSGK